MTPANLDKLYSITHNLAAGFETLLRQVEEQQRTEEGLRLRLKQIAGKYEEHGTSTEPSSTEISDWREEIVKQISPPVERPPTRTLPTSNVTVELAQEALVHFRSIEMPSRTELRKCPVAHKTTDQEDFEHDFTTQGVPGDLGCPFAKTHGDFPTCTTDPIAAEFHGDRSSTRSPDAGGSRCPIRFLDKHSPEEIAQYFENHKHEIPRSHEICVKRYQANENSIRQLDAKYGNMVSMIQGLGTKHKQYLPEDEEPVDERDESSNKAVEKWAENVSHTSQPAKDSERIPRFEQTLRDIRVGESPSRPWGIQVPLDHSPASSVAPSVNGHAKSMKTTSSTPAPAAPIAVAALPSTRAEALPEAEAKMPERQRPGQQPQIVFNGPVFFGYSAEQAAIFLQNLNVGGSK